MFKEIVRFLQGPAGVVGGVALALGSALLFYKQTRDQAEAVLLLQEGASAPEAPPAPPAGGAPGEAMRVVPAPPGSLPS